MYDDKKRDEFEDENLRFIFPRKLAGLARDTKNHTWDFDENKRFMGQRVRKTNFRNVFAPGCHVLLALTCVLAHSCLALKVSLCCAMLCSVHNHLIFTIFTLSINIKEIFFLIVDTFFTIYTWNNFNNFVFKIFCVLIKQNDNSLSTLEI